MDVTLVEMHSLVVNAAVAIRMNKTPEGHQLRVEHNLKYSQFLGKHFISSIHSSM